MRVAIGGAEMVGGRGSRGVGSEGGGGKAGGGGREGSRAPRSNSVRFFKGALSIV